MTDGPLLPGMQRQAANTFAARAERKTVQSGLVDDNLESELDEGVPLSMPRLNWGVGRWRLAPWLLVYTLGTACTTHATVAGRALPSPSPATSPSVTPSLQAPATTTEPIVMAPPGAAPTRHSNAQPNRDGSCSSGQLQGLYAEGVVPVTGEHSAWTNLFNISKLGCKVRGYPEVEFHSARLALPFRVSHHGLYIDGPNAGPPPKAVPIRIRPGGAAHFLIAKYRCDVGEVAVVRSLNIKISAAGSWISVALPPAYAGPGFSYCKAYNGAPDRSDPGNYMEVGPLIAGRVLGT